MDSFTLHMATPDARAHVQERFPEMDSSAQTTSSTEKQSDSTLSLDLLTLKNSLQDDTHHKYISFFCFCKYPFIYIISI